MKNFFKWSLIVVVLVIVVIAAIHFAEGEFDKNAKEDVKTEMLQVQAKSKIVLEKYHVDKENGLKGEKMEDASLEEQFNITDISKFYKWTKDTLQEEGIKEPVINENEYYLINYDTEEVVYSAGYKAEDGNIYYKLSDIKNIKLEKEETIEKNEEIGEVASDGEGDNKTE